MRIDSRLIWRYCRIVTETAAQTDPADRYTAALAAELRAQRGVTGKTFPVISEATGITVQTLQRIFKGQRDLRASHLILIADALGVSVSDIVTAAQQRVDSE